MTVANRTGQVPSVDGVIGEPRGKLLTALCGRPQTAVELADQVGTSSNAIRVHLEGLRTAGLVDYTVARRGVGKPTHVFSLTADGEALLSKAYVPTLQALVDTLRARLNGGFEAMLRESGQALQGRIATDPPHPGRKGVEAALDSLEALGSPATVEKRGKERILTNQCCPLSAITRETPEVCRMMETLLSTASGVQMRERCERSEHPRCAFVIEPRGRARARPR